MQVGSHLGGPTEEKYDPGGSAIVSRSEYQGRPIAIKTLRLYTASDLEECFSVGTKSHRYYWRSVLTTGPLEISQGGHCLETSTTPEHLPVCRCESGMEQTRDCIRVDGSR